MRQPSDLNRICELMRHLGRETRSPARVYFTGGATAVLIGWRASTIDVDIGIEGDSREILRAIPGLKESLQINVELASPSDFIPELPGWRDRCSFVQREESLDFFHYDFYAQALAKIERAHPLDLTDVRAMLDRGLIEPARARDLFERIEPELYRYPAVDPPSFRARVETELTKA
jgi:hypothetical protein